VLTFQVDALPRRGAARSSAARLFTAEVQLPWTAGRSRGATSFASGTALGDREDQGHVAQPDQLRGGARRLRLQQADGQRGRETPSSQEAWLAATPQRAVSAGHGREFAPAAPQVAVVHGRPRSRVNSKVPRPSRPKDRRRNCSPT
jgi:hypothetical protein